jgi:hypothetical protein
MEGSHEAICEISKSGSPYIGTVTYFPEKYGPDLVDLILRLVNCEQVPPFWYVDHEFVDHARASRMLTASSAETQLEAVQ